MGYKLAIFDMDGTILDTLEDLKNSLNFSLARRGFPSRTTAEVRSFVGNGIRRLVELGAPTGTASGELDMVFDEFNRHYAVHCADNTRPYDGITEALTELRESGVMTAVVSNKADYAVRSLSERYFEGLFDCAVGARDGIRKKPFPDSVNEVLRALSAGRADAVYIGDSEVDIMTAKNAEMDCISVDWGFRDRGVLVENGASLIVSDTAAMVGEILKRSARR